MCRPSGLGPEGPLLSPPRLLLWAHGARPLEACPTSLLGVEATASGHGVSSPDTPGSVGLAPGCRAGLGEATRLLTNHTRVPSPLCPEKHRAGDTGSWSCGDRQWHLLQSLGWSRTMAGHTAWDTSAPLQGQGTLPAPVAASRRRLPRLLSGTPILDTHGPIFRCFSFSVSGGRVLSIGLIISAAGLLLGQERGGSPGMRQLCLSRSDLVPGTTGGTGPPSGQSSGHRASFHQGDVLGGCGSPGKCSAGLPTGDPGIRAQTTVTMTECILALRVCGGGQEGRGGGEGSSRGHVIERHVPRARLRGHLPLLLY